MEWSLGDATHGYEAAENPVGTGLYFMTEGRGETPMADNEGSELPMAKRQPENPALPGLIDRIVA